MYSIRKELEAGYITQEEYDELLATDSISDDIAQAWEDIEKSHSEQQETTIITGVADEMRVEPGSGDQHTNIDYSAPSDPSLAGYRIN